MRRTGLLLRHPRTPATTVDAGVDAVVPDQDQASGTPTTVSARMNGDHVPGPHEAQHLGQLRPVDVRAQQPFGARPNEHDAIELALRVPLKRTNPLTADAPPTHRLPLPVSCPDEVVNVGHMASIKGRGQPQSDAVCASC